MEELERKLNDIFQLQPQNTEEHIFKVRDITIFKIRDILMKLGNIAQENLEDQEYFAAVNAGLLKSNVAYMACRLDGEKLYVVITAKEGLINQNTCKGALYELKRELNRYIEGEE